MLKTIVSLIMLRSALDNPKDHVLRMDCILNDLTVMLYDIYDDIRNIEKDFGIPFTKTDVLDYLTGFMDK